MSHTTIHRQKSHQRFVLPDFLPGLLRIERGTARDYDALAAFHYVDHRPATFASVRVVKYRDRVRQILHGEAVDRIVAVGVLSYPVPCIHARSRHLGLIGTTRPEQLDFANRNIRTISRLVVHPQFRSLGLATGLIRCLCNDCTTRYIEAIAHMGRSSPIFLRAGFNRGNSERPQETPYFILDRGGNI